MSTPTQVIISSGDAPIKVVIGDKVIPQVINPIPEQVVKLGVQGPMGPQGRPGPEGPQGPKGLDGDGASDPGDLTLIFENQLI